jgi:hypothetical protein
VNFVPRSAFERNKPLYTYSVAWMWKDAERAFMPQARRAPRWGEKTYKIHPGVDVSAVVPVNKTFGFSVSGGYSLQYTPQPNTAMQWRGAADGDHQSPPTAVPTGTGTGFPHHAGQSLPRHFLVARQRQDTPRATRSRPPWTGGRPARPHHLRVPYGMLKENFATRSPDLHHQPRAPGNWSPTHTWGRFSTFPTTGGAVNAGTLAITNSGRIRPGRTISPSLRWLHEGPRWKSDAGVSTAARAFTIRTSTKAPSTA